MRYLFSLLFICFLSSACTDARYGKFAVLNSSAIVTCYSGGKIYFHARSTGAVANEDGSDGFFAKWVDLDDDGKETDGKEYYASISGDCKIVYSKD